VRTGQDIVIPEAKYAKSFFLQKSVPRTIGSCLILMLTSVDLNNKPLLDADEVDDVWSDRMLAPKLVRQEST